MTAEFAYTIESDGTMRNTYSVPHRFHLRSTSTSSQVVDETVFINDGACLHDSLNTAHAKIIKTLAPQATVTDVLPISPYSSMVTNTNVYIQQLEACNQAAIQ